MKFSRPILAGAGLVGCANAFPALMKEFIKERAAELGPEAMADIEARANPYIGGNVVVDPAYIAQYFNPVEQYVSNTGIHAFVPPGPNDQRGPCPGLNAMANHNYISHTGVDTILNYITGTSAVFGMGTDLAGFLSVYAAVFDGNLAVWSIGGPSIYAPSISGQLGTPQGLSGSHNKYEADVSPTRGDLYQYGNDYLARTQQFKALYAYQASQTEQTSNYNLKVLEQFRSVRFTQSIQGNPYFFNAPFSGVLVQPAAYTFIYRFMGNKSAAHPEGRLSQNVLKTFFSMTGPDKNGDFSYKAGYEAIPNNWYKRSPTISPYTIPFFNLDLIEEAVYDPRFLSIGGNTGTTNSFAGVNVADLTGGVYNTATVTPQNAMCLAFESTLQQAPDLLEGIFTDTTAAQSQFSTAVVAAEKALGIGCPKLTNYDKSQFSKYPGYQKSGGAAK